MFVRPKSGWAGALTETARLTASDGTAHDWFGGIVAVSGDTIVARAYTHTVGGHRQQGEVYVFVRPRSGGAGALTQTATLIASNGVARDTLGNSVAVAGDTIVATAPQHKVGKHIQQGETYAFVRPKSGWSGTHTQTATLTASNAAFGDYLGSSVAMSGNTIVVGAPFHPPIGQHKMPGPGEAYVFQSKSTKSPALG